MFVVVAVTTSVWSCANAGAVQGVVVWKVAPVESSRRAPAGSAPRMTLAQAPAALQAVVRRSVLPAAATPLEQAELTAKDTATDDRFGWSVALAGTTALIGAPYKNSSKGASYVFVRTGTSWTQQAELTAKDAATGDGLGFSVALSGTTALIGAPYKNSSKGASYVFVRTGTSWTQQAELTAKDAATGDNFGRSVALSGTTALIGAPGKNSSKGASYVFVHTGASWSQQAELTANDAATGDRFGRSVALSGTTALIGAPGKNPSTGSPNVVAAPSPHAISTAKDAATYERFGYSVAVSGKTTLIGAPYHTSSRGVAYVFVRTGTSWSQQAELTASDAATGDNFGSSVALSGTTALIGALYKKTSTGAAYVFVHTGASWSQQAELTANDAATGDYFGSSVALSGTTAVISAVGKNTFTGGAYVFAGLATSWSQQAELTASDSATNDFVGWSVAVSGTTAMIGAPDKDTSRGAAYVFATSASSRGWWA